MFLWDTGYPSRQALRPLKLMVYPHKAPEPIHLAHKLASEKRKELIEEKS